MLASAALLRELGIEVAEPLEDVKRLRAIGASVVFLAVDGRLAGRVALTDPIKDTTPAAIDALHRAGIRVVMATGDGMATAETVARRLRIDEVHGGGWHQRCAGARAR